MESIDESLQERLKAVKDSVRKATEQAMKDAAGESQIELRFKDNLDAATGENGDPNSSESFALGMTLFGKDVSAVEREIRDKLNRVEAELKEVVIAVETQDGETSDKNDDGISDDPETLQAEAEMLTSRIHFLRECSSARSLLDEAIMISSSATPNEPDFVESARLLAKAQVALQKAQDVVRAEEERSSEPTPALLGGYRILDAIRNPIRRKRVELLSKATALLESSITLTSESVSVRGGRMGPGHSQQAQGLNAAYDILEALSPADNERLNCVLKRLTDRLFDVVIKPQLDAQRQSSSSVKPLVFQEVSDGTKGLTGRVTLTKTPTHTLEWSVAENAATADLGSSASPEELSIRAWEVTFKFVQRIMSFVEEHVLLKKAPLCEFVGQRLFGKKSDVPGNGLNLEAFGLESSILGDDKGLFVKPAVQLM